MRATSLRRLLLTDRDRPAGGARSPRPDLHDRALPARGARGSACPTRATRLELHVHADRGRGRARCLARAGSRAASRLLLVTPGAASARASSGPPSTSPAPATGSGTARPLPLVVARAERRRDCDREARLRRDRGPTRRAARRPTPRCEVFVALVARASLVLTNDTGPRHVAVALDRPVVTLLGPTDRATPRTGSSGRACCSRTSPAGRAGRACVRSATSAAWCASVPSARWRRPARCSRRADPRASPLRRGSSASRGEPMQRRGTSLCTCFCSRSARRCSPARPARGRCSRRPAGDAASPRPRRSSRARTGGPFRSRATSR